MGLRYLPPIRTFDHLRYLDLTGLTGLTDDAVTGIVRFMPRIRNLIVAKCTGLTDDAVVAICGLGRHLHYLHMGHVSALVFFFLSTYSLRLFSSLRLLVFESGEVRED